MNKIHGMISIVVIVILLSALAIPVMQSAGGNEKTLDVLIIDGQSNAEYGDTSVCDPEVLNAEYTEKPNRNILYYGTNTAPANQWDWSTYYFKSWAAYHLHNAYDYATEKWIIGGYEPILGNTISKKTDNDVLVINMAIGARTIAQLLPDGADGDYSWGVLDHALNQAKRTYDSFNMVGVVWIQGESDKDTPVAEYEESFEELMDAFEKYDAEKFYIVHTRDSYGGNANVAQEYLANEYSNVEISTYITETFTQENGMLDSNPIHYSQKGRDAISFAIMDKIDIDGSIVDTPTDKGLIAVIGIILLVLFIIPVLIAIRMIKGRM